MADLDRILEDFLDPAVTELQLCSYHGIKLDELSEIIDSPKFAQALATIVRIRDARAPHITASQVAAASERLAEIARFAPEEPARKAATTLIRFCAHPPRVRNNPAQPKPDHPRTPAIPQAPDADTLKQRLTQSRRASRRLRPRPNTHAAPGPHTDPAVRFRAPAPPVVQELPTTPVPPIGPAGTQPRAETSAPAGVRTPYPPRLPPSEGRPTAGIAVETG